jgi:hypothetical protein
MQLPSTNVFFDNSLSNLAEKFRKTRISAENHRFVASDCFGFNLQK